MPLLLCTHACRSHYHVVSTPMCRCCGNWQVWSPQWVTLLNLLKRFHLGLFVLSSDDVIGQQITGCSCVRFHVQHDVFLVHGVLLGGATLTPLPCVPASVPPNRQMLFCRVTLGKSFLQFSAMKMAHAPPGHHSVIGRPSVNGLAYAEYVIYRGEQVRFPTAPSSSEQESLQTVR